MRYCVSSYSYAGLVRRGEFRERELPALAAGMGFSGIEFAELHPDEGQDKLSYAAALRKEAERCGISLTAYCVGANLLNGEEEISRLCREVDVAAALGVGLLRHDAAGDFQGERSEEAFTKALPALVRGYRAVTQYAAHKGIVTAIENHGFFCQDSHRVRAVIEGVGHENFGALLDVGNFLCVDEDPREAVKVLAPYALHVHCKDFHFRNAGEGTAPGYFATRGGNFLCGAVIGEGIVPVEKCLRLIRDAGYNGTLTVEFEGREDPKLGVAQGLSNLRGMVSRL